MRSASSDWVAPFRGALRLRTLAGTALLGPMLWLYGCVPDHAGPDPAIPRTQPVEVTEIARRDLLDILTLVGTLRARESAQIHPELSGIVKSIHFQEGQQVEAGMVLVKIDDSRLRAELDSAHAAFRLAEQTLSRVQSLRRSNNLAEAEYDQALAEFDRAAAQLALTRTLLGKAEIRAPFDGVVGARTISPGDYVTPATSLVSVDDLSRMRVTFEVPQRYLQSVQVGSSFQIRASGVSNCAPIAGQTYFVSTTVDARTRSGRVDGLLTDPPDSLRPGMFVNVDLVLGVREQALVVPEGAIFMSAGGPQIVVASPAGEGYEAQFRNVQLGLRRDGMVELRSAEAQAGEPVVAAGVGALALYPGTPLDPRPAVGLYEPIGRY